MSLWAQNKLMPIFQLSNPGKVIQIFLQNFNFSGGDLDHLKKLLQIKGWTSFSEICLSTNRKIEITEKYLDEFSRICQEGFIKEYRLGPVRSVPPGRVQLENFVSGVLIMRSENTFL